MGESPLPGITARTFRSVWELRKGIYSKKAGIVAFVIFVLFWGISGFDIGLDALVVAGISILLFIALILHMLLDAIKYVDCSVCGAVRTLDKINQDLENRRERSCDTCGVAQ